VQWSLSRGGRALMADELRNSFPGDWTPGALRDVMRRATELQVQAMVEELVLGRLTAETVGRYMDYDGRAHLDEALSHGKGVLLAFPHAGNVMMLIARLSLSGYDFTQVAARGLPPPDKIAPADLQPTWLNVKAREAREADEDRLPAKFHTMDAAPRELYRILGRNGIVAIAFDGRGGSKFRLTPFLGRTALLNTGPWRLAASTGARVVPAFCRHEADGRWSLVLAPAIVPDPALPVPERAEALLEAFLRGAIEPWLRAHPDHYARWLLHCRVHADMDDNPLFVDTAAHDGWRRHEGVGF
jgi:lauroyl/myristoyl acyltransferase